MPSTLNNISRLRHECRSALNAAGFRRVDYYGPGPVNRQEWCTSLFVRDLEIFRDSIDSPQGDCDLGW